MLVQGFLQAAGTPDFGLSIKTDASTLGLPNLPPVQEFLQTAGRPLWAVNQRIPSNLGLPNLPPVQVFLQTARRLLWAVQLVP